MSSDVRQEGGPVVRPSGPYVHPLDAMAWQDALLQSYRNLQLVLQSILVAVGAGLTTAVLGFSDEHRVRIAAVLLWAIAITAIWVMSRLRGVVRARAQAVNYWQKEVIRAEYSDGGPRYFSRFRVWLIQQAEPHPSIRSLIDSDALTEDQVALLLEHGGARIRKVVDDSLYWAVIALWILFLAASLVVVTNVWEPSNPRLNPTAAESR